MLSVIIIIILYAICLLIAHDSLILIYIENPPIWLLYVFNITLVAACTRILVFLLGTLFPKKVYVHEELLEPMEDGIYLQVQSDGKNNYFMIKMKDKIISIKENTWTNVITVYDDEVRPSLRIEDTDFVNQYLSLFFYKINETKFYIYIPTSELGNPIKTIYDDKPSMDGIHGM